MRCSARSHHNAGAEGPIRLTGPSTTRKRYCLPSSQAHQVTKLTTNCLPIPLLLLELWLLWWLSTSAFCAAQAGVYSSANGAIIVEKNYTPGVDLAVNTVVYIVRATSQPQRLVLAQGFWPKGTSRRQVRWDFAKPAEVTSRIMTTSGLGR